ncbi:MAG: ABC transporter permease [Edaphobacter sp.]
MALVQRIRNLIRRSQIDREIEAELNAHLAMRTEDNIAAGMTPQDARRDATLRFGNPAATKEKVAGADTALGLASLGYDLRFALRQLRKSPGFSAPSVLILGVAIGACTTIFSAVKPILLDPLPYPQSSRLMMLWEMRSSGAPLDVAFATFRGLTERSHSFDAIAVMKPWQPAMSGGDQPGGNQTVGSQPERFDGQRVSANYFQVLGISPIIGRGFQPSDDVFRGPNVVILSDALWQRRFARDPGIVGTQVRLDDTLYTVIGVMPHNFENVLAPGAELWAPLQYNPSLPSDGREWGHHLHMAARLRPDITRQQATSELSSILPALAKLNAKGYDGTGGAPNRILINPLQHEITQAVRPALLAVLGAVALILFIACVNVTNLLLARAAQRRAEFSIRAALGAAKARLIRQLLTESLLLAIFGALCGTLIAAGGIKALVALSPPGLPRVNAIGLHGGVFVFALAITTILGIVVGLVPALHATSSSLRAGLEQNSRGSVGSSHTTRRILVIVEISLAFVLLVSAGLLLRSMHHLLSIDPGFDTSHLLTMQIQETGRRFDADAARAQFFSSALESVRQIPGVVSAGLTSQLPLSSDFDVYGVEVQRENNPRGDGAFRYAVTPGYIETMHIPLRRGRLFNDHDIVGAPTVVLINEALAASRFPNQDPIGQHVRMGLDVDHPDRPWATVIGVVGNVKQQSLAAADEDAFYIPTTQWPWVDNVQSLVVRTHGDAASLAPSVRNGIWSIDKDQPVIRVATMGSLLATTAAERRFVLVLFEFFGITALVLATVGIYGILAGSVTERKREMGVRTALGASRRNILTLVLRQGMTLVAIGAAIGLAAAIFTSQALVPLLFGISKLDPVTYLGVIALLLGVSAIACLIPARRAASANPVDALRAE